MQVKACIFDLDGVIVDTAKYHFLAWKRLADQLGIHFTEIDNEKLKGVSRRDSLEIILQIGKTDLPWKVKSEFAERKNGWYLDYILNMTPEEILPGCLTFVNQLRNAGIPVAIGSSSKNTRIILERIGLTETFDAIADGNIISNAKPDPEVFNMAAYMVGTEPGNCVVFEDAIAGVQAALNAGMMCVGVGSAQVLGKAHFVVPDLTSMSLDKLLTIGKEILL